MRSLYLIVNKGLRGHERLNLLPDLALGLLPFRVAASPGLAPLSKERANLKKILLLASLAVLSTPYLASAQGWRPIGGRPHRGISAPEMATAGFGIAALIGVAGYLVLRQRNSA